MTLKRPRGFPFKRPRKEKRHSHTTIPRVPICRIPRLVQGGADDEWAVSKIRVHCDLAPAFLFAQYVWFIQVTCSTQMEVVRIDGLGI